LVMKRSRGCTARTMLSIAQNALDGARQEIKVVGKNEN